MLDRLLAALTLFTRLPWYKIREIPADAFKHATDFWPWAGFITGGTMALTFFICIQILPLTLSLILTIGVRLLLTGALHEDGLADLCDGIGGGTTRERKLEIMKDSHIGTYGVIGLIIYFLLFYSTMEELSLSYLRFSVQNVGFSTSNPILMICSTLWIADIWGKGVASFITTLPYARNEETSKVKTIYESMNSEKAFTQVVRIIIAVIIPFILMLASGLTPCIWSFIAPIVIFCLIRTFLKRQLNGYTGDCCGATFLICELSFILTQQMCL